MGGRRSKRKGAVGEREAAKAITEHLGIEAHRGCQNSGGPDSPDVRIELEGVHVEVKRTERLSLYEAVNQAENDAEGKVPVVLHRRNNREWLLVVPLKRTMDLVTKLFLARSAEN